MTSVVQAGLIAVALVTLPGAVRAQCAEFESIAGPPVEYDPFSSAPVNQAFDLRISRLAPEATAVRFVIADATPDGAGSRLGPDGPRDYHLAWMRDASRRVFVAGAEQPNAANGALVPFGPGAAGALVQESFRLSAPAGQSVTAGLFEEPLEIRYVCYSGGDPMGGVEVQRTDRVTVAMETRERIAVHVGSAGQRRGEIDLGALDLRNHASGSVAITAQATTPYEISVGAWRGVLRRADADPAGLPYSLRLNGAPIATGDRIACDATPAPGGRTHSLEVSVRASDARLAPAGTYSDVVTVTFAPWLGLSASAGCSG